MEVDSIPSRKEALQRLYSLIHLDDEDDGNNRNIFAAQESMETISLDDSILNINVQSLNGISDLLYSEEIYLTEKDIGIKMPVDSLREIGHKVIVLIGVSGCGKTRTCYDLCRDLWCLFFDCIVDVDFNTMVDQLIDIRPRTKTKESQQIFEVESERRLKCLLASRMLVLEALRERNPDLKSFQWLCIQRSGRTRKLFSAIFNELSRLPASVISEIFEPLKGSFPNNGRIIFDESHRMLDLLELDYRSTKPSQRNITDGKFDVPRALFSFVTRYIAKSGLKSIWCGTQMRIRSMELIYSAAGLKREEIYLFTQFNYLEPGQIFQLLGRWLKGVNVTQNISLFEEIAHFLQGRPRFFTSFLHKLIDSNDLLGSFQIYRRDMTESYDSALDESSPYFFWKERIDWTIEPIEPSDGNAFERKLVSDTLVKLCLAFLFGDGSHLHFSPDLDLVSTCLVMVNKKADGWYASMAEPLILSAGVNYLANQGTPVLMNYFAAQLFAPMTPPHLTPQERGHMMELVIALRFIQGWWTEVELQKCLPQWATALGIPKPLGVIDSRRKVPSVDMFIQQLCNRRFPWMLFPPVNAGPDLRYSIFSCCVKTTWTANSKSSMYVSVEECEKNISTMDPTNWYKSQPSVYATCQEDIANQQFIHLRFELPDTAPSQRKEFQLRAQGNDYVICVNLASDFATKFFGARFVAQYKEFVEREINK